MNRIPLGPGRLTTIAVTGGKGGVGKTNVAVNLAMALAGLRYRVALLDADFGLGNIDVMLGLAPVAHLGHVLNGEQRMADILAPGPHGVHVIPAGSGLRSLTALTPLHWQRLRDGIAELEREFDYLIVDTAAGVSDNVLEMLGLADRVLVVTTLEPTAVVDAYAVIKLLTASGAAAEVGLLVNYARDSHEAELVFAQLELAVERFLRRRLPSFGFIPHDGAVRDAVLMQRPLVDHAPQSAAGRSFRQLAARLSGTPAQPRQLRIVARGDNAAPGAPRCA